MRYMGMSEQRDVGVVLLSGEQEVHQTVLDVVHMSVCSHEAHTVHGEQLDQRQFGEEVAVAPDGIVSLIGKLTLDLIQLIPAVATVYDYIGVAVELHYPLEVTVRAVGIGYNDYFHILHLPA